MKTFKKILKWGSLSIAVVLVLAGALLAHTWYFKPLSINWFYTKTLIQFVKDSPQTLTSLGLLEGMGIRGHNAHLNDGSEENNERMMEMLRESLATLRSYDRERLDDQGRVTYDVAEMLMDIGVESDRWRYHSYPMNQLFGIQNGLPTFMATTHRIPDRLGAEHYISRLSQFDRRLTEALESVQAREARGIIPPTFVVEKVLTEMRGFVDTPVRENILYTALDEKLGELVDSAELTEEARQELAAQAEAEINDTVYPVYRRLIAYYEELLPRTTGNHGVWALPDGDEMYAFSIRVMTTTSMSAEEIHAIGLAEVARIAAEMDAILVGAGYTEGTIGERIWALKEDPDQLYEDSDAGREQILADYQTIIDEISAGLGDWFDRTPEAPVEVERIPEFREATAPGAYYNQPALDGSRPGVFYANLRDVSEIPRFGMRTLAYHEAVPGHHFQIALTLENEELPFIRRMIPATAYVEGWALYSEQVAWEAGFQDDPLDNLGRLQAEMFRACRLVVDTGMHALRWTREDAIDYMIRYTGMGAKEIESEVERYLVMPGQALAYKIGMLRILELRDRARAQLGDDFDIREFHNVVLGNGPLPLDILERVVEDWLATKS
jgi:uncharacterized protein (DUF885 family)